MSTLEEAISLASSAHLGQLYPSPEPEPFILHPIRVMLKVSTGPARIVAMLHDVVEDTGVTLNDLRELNFADDVVIAIERLTKRPRETYDAYIHRLELDLLAREVKIADLSDNLANNRRLPTSAEVIARIERYERAIAVLNSHHTSEKLSAGEIRSGNIHAAKG